ncbi:hypothetical protein [Burkholderia sp. BE17]|uniref:hypothetical protein n=1 Tax=Burkholderia sp. BE17 TaxID=2656644 RepID=UPI002AB07167|nr:hypothetical protein [Burkholderia sp. BE17]
MNPTLYTAVLIALALVLVSMFGFGFYWLATKDRRSAPETPPPPSRSFATVDGELDEWEAHAPYPDHALDALHDFAPASSSSVGPSRTSFTSPEYDEHYFRSVPPSPETPRAPPTSSTASDYFSYAPQQQTPEPSSSGDSLRCPHCGSSHIDTLNVGRRAGSAIGSVAGATSGFAMALSGAEAGAAVGAIGGPVGAVFGGLAGAVVAGLLGSAAGSVAGSAVGGVLDDNVLDNYRCQSCGHCFGSTLR